MSRLVPLDKQVKTTLKPSRSFPLRVLRLKPQVLGLKPTGLLSSPFVPWGRRSTRWQPTRSAQHRWFCVPSLVGLVALFSVGRTEDGSSPGTLSILGRAFILSPPTGTPWPSQLSAGGVQPLALTPCGRSANVPRLGKAAGSCSCGWMRAQATPQDSAWGWRLSRGAYRWAPGDQGMILTTAAFIESPNWKLSTRHC